MPYVGKSTGGWQIIKTQKSNTMKVKDLMIGDWVLCPQQFNNWHRVTAIDGLDNEVETTSDLYDAEEISPIPLTPEILEKNGFVEQAFIQNSIWSISGFSLECHFTTWEYYWANGDVTIGYVHELQHALRLCGIEKEIMI